MVVNKVIAKVVLVSVFFAFCVVILGAYTRLTDAGLGCPDWPGCYGHMVLPHEKQKLNHAQKVFPDQPIEARKAWTEMIHRYAAGSLGLVIVFLAFMAIKKHRQQQPFPKVAPFLLVGLVFFQAALGMWTVTLKLLPVVVMGHLLGGFSILACLWWCYLSLNAQGTANLDKLSHFKPWVFAGLIIVMAQIALGGWVSSNYAGLSCVGFPMCNGMWVPPLNFHEAFNVLSPIGANYQGGVLDSTSRMTIQFVHRIGAMVTATYILALSLTLIAKAQGRMRQLGMLTLVVVLFQFTLGILNVVKLLPLDVAVSHNGVAALLLLCLVALVHPFCYRESRGEYQS